MFRFRAPPTEKQSHMLDLLDVNLGEASGGAAQVDPWGVPIAPPPPRPQVFNPTSVLYYALKRPSSVLGPGYRIHLHVKRLNFVHY